MYQPDSKVVSSRQVVYSWSLRLWFNFQPDLAGQQSGKAEFSEVRASGSKNVEPQTLSFPWLVGGFGHLRSLLIAWANGPA